MKSGGANPGEGAPMGIEESSLSGGAPKRWRVGGGWVRSAESNIGALVGIPEHPSQAEERGNGGIEWGIK
jgi:hypothetical protein